MQKTVIRTWSYRIVLTIGLALALLAPGLAPSAHAGECLPAGVGQC